MDGAKQVLEGEYIKRLWLSSDDESRFLDFIDPHKKDGKIDFYSLERSNKMEEYNNLAYYAACSALEKMVLENYIHAHGKTPSTQPIESALQDKINVLRKLQQNVGFDSSTGGFVDEYEGSGSSGRAVMLIDNTEIDMTGLTIEDQIKKYTQELERIINMKMGLMLDPVLKEEQLKDLCVRIEDYSTQFEDLVKEEQNSKKQTQLSSEPYQKIIKPDQGV